MNLENCPFCKLDKKRVINEREFSYALLDIYPVSKGHTLIIPKRHVLSIEDLNNKEIIDLFENLIKIKEALKNYFKCDGFNIGINLGEVSGQTIEHIHIHLIPRYKNDTNFPFGGVRKVVLDFLDFDKEKLKEKLFKNSLKEEEIEKLRNYIKSIDSK